MEAEISKFIFKVLLFVAFIDGWMFLPLGRGMNGVFPTIKMPLTLYEYAFSDIQRSHVDLPYIKLDLLVSSLLVLLLRLF